MHATHVFFPQTLQLPLTSVFSTIDPQDSQLTSIESLFQPLDKASRTEHFAIQQSQALIATQLSTVHAFASQILQCDGVTAISADKSKIHSKLMRFLIYHIYRCEKVLPKGR
jgi:hypothetical protein